MTSGSINPSLSDTTDKNPGKSKVWTGSNGKKEVYQGVVREKWNDYSVTLSNWSACIVGAGDNTAGPPANSWMISVLPSDAKIDRVLPSNNVELSTLSKLVTNIRGHDFNLAVNIATGKQTMDLISDNLGHVGRSLVYLKHGNVSGALRELGVSGRNRLLKTKDVSSRWLELQYGWLPFLSDSYEAFKAYHEIVKKPRKNTYSASVMRSGIGDNSSSPSNYSMPFKATSGCRIIAELTESISAPRSLGLMNPLSVVWEIIPYSFVLDWFLPIGTYLEVLGVVPSLKGRFLTTRIRKSEGYAGVDLNKSNDFSGHYVNSRSGFHISLTRTVSTTLSVPTPRFVGLPSAMSPTRIYNAVALFHQKLQH